MDGKPFGYNPTVILPQPKKQQVLERVQGGGGGSALLTEQEGGATDGQFKAGLTGLRKLVPGSPEYNEKRAALVILIEKSGSRLKAAQLAKLESEFPEYYDEEEDTEEEENTGSEYESDEEEETPNPAPKKTTQTPLTKFQQAKKNANAARNALEKAKQTVKNAPAAAKAAAEAARKAAEEAEAAAQEELAAAQKAVEEAKGRRESLGEVEAASSAASEEGEEQSKSAESDDLEPESYNITPIVDESSISQNSTRTTPVTQTQAQPSSPPVEMVTLSNGYRVRKVKDDMKADIIALKFLPYEQLLFDRHLKFNTLFTKKYIQEHPEDFYEFWKLYVNKDGTDTFNLMTSAEGKQIQQFFHEVLSSYQEYLIESSLAFLRNGKEASAVNTTPEPVIKKEDRLIGRPSAPAPAPAPAPVTTSQQQQEETPVTQLAKGAEEAEDEEAEEAEDITEKRKRIEETLEAKLDDTNLIEKYRLQNALKFLHSEIKDLDTLYEYMGYTAQKIQYNLQLKKITLTEFLKTYKPTQKTSNILKHILHEMLRIDISSPSLDPPIKISFTKFFTRGWKDQQLARIKAYIDSPST
jgi:hypothetical protein